MDWRLISPDNKNISFGYINSDIDLNEDWLKFVDFRDLEKYSNHVNNFKPDWLFHIGAYTDLEYCEQNEKDTYDTNTESVKNAVSISNDLKGN